MSWMEKIDQMAFAEGFPMWVSRLVITALNPELAQVAGQVSTGYGTSIIMAPGEAGIEREVDAAETPDGRPGVVVQFWHRGRKQLKKILLGRVSQAILTAPTTAVFDYLLEETEHTLSIGKNIRYFGDGYEKKDTITGHEVYRIPVMDGEFVIESVFKTKKGVAGGNLLIIGKSLSGALEAAQGAVKATRQVEGVILPFPGGICRSGSKVGSKYKFLGASTNHPYCPTIREVIPDSLLPENAKAVYELVINGLSEVAVKQAMRAAMERAALHSDVISITAANYGGTLGPFKMELNELLKM
ncbi:MAG: formylmethanofuran--tetrahydromethanopterin N-formyltransferase [Candidatus Heimdallarchaeota archaeon]